MKSVLKCRLQLNLTEIVLKYKIPPTKGAPYMSDTAITIRMAEESDAKALLAIYAP